jgi:hypothetical protein
MSGPFLLGAWKTFRIAGHGGFAQTQKVLMPYRPRELAIRARESATLLLSALDHDEMVERFLDTYAAENRRPGHADQPGHYREQVETIRREAILAMALRVESVLPARFKVHTPIQTAKSGKKRKKGKKSRRAIRVAKPRLIAGTPLLDLFREEFFVALGQALDWSEDDARGFWHDLDLYENLRAREPSRDARRSARPSAAGPFAERVALLVDPSLMEEARRAATQFQANLNSAADQVLRKVFSRRRAN